MHELNSQKKKKETKRNEEQMENEQHWYYCRLENRATAVLVQEEGVDCKAEAGQLRRRIAAKAQADANNRSAVPADSTALAEEDIPTTFQRGVVVGTKAQSCMWDMVVAGMT